MLRNKFAGFICALLVGALPSLRSSATAQTVTNYVIGPQDVLQITLLDDPSMSGKYTVEADGEFTFPLIGRIKAAGLNTREFEAALKKRLSPDFFKNPQVTVAVEQYKSQRVFVTGEVRIPGPVPLTGGMKLSEALVRVGSTQTSASGEVAIVRQKQVEPIHVNLKDLEAGDRSQDIELQDGDQIYVLRAESVYVSGEVKNPGAYPVQRTNTVLQALALAGGATQNGALNRIKISRVEGGKRIEIKNVKLTDLVRPGDTIIVPEKYF